MLVGSKGVSVGVDGVEGVSATQAEPFQLVPVPQLFVASVSALAASSAVSAEPSLT